jgi:hypothetical protein
MCGTLKTIPSSSACHASINSDCTVGRRKRRNRISVSPLPKHQKQDQRQSQKNLDEEEMEIVSISSIDKSMSIPNKSNIIDLTEMDHSPHYPAPTSLLQQPKNTIGMVETCTPSFDSTLAKSSSCTAHESIEDAILINVNGKSLPRPPSQSAYLQHLAEICATILYDERWKGVMSWEAGDDLSAVVALAKFEEDESDHGDFSGRHCCEKEEKSLQQFEEEARAMLLYSRMFVRKGPWFRLDDLLKYYCSPNSFFSSAAQEKDQIDHNQDHEAEEERVHLHPSNTDQRKSHSSIFYGDDPVKALFRDVNYLLSIGLIRSFFDENECGVISGNNKSNGGLLTVEERNILLRKIGCGPQKGNYSHAIGTLTRNDTRTNRVILQMRSQKPLFFRKIHTPAQSQMAVTNSDDSTSQRPILLPVRHHVETIIQNSIFDKSERMCQTNELEGIGYIPPLCIRLTEKPLQCVRRCARLFLIAGGGPGSMRESGWLSVQESPVQPCISEDMAHSVVHSSSLSTWSTVPYPGLQQRLKLKTFFFQSDYKKLRYQQERQLNMPTIVANKESNVSIFRGGVLQFQCWEVACEIRAQVSYLIEINQLLESTKRRERKRQSSESGGAKTSSIEFDQSIINCNYVEDSLNVLNVDGRETLVLRLLQDCNLQKPTVDLIISKITSSLVDSADVKSENKAIAILISIVCIIVHVLRARISFLASNVVCDYLSRPWLRHFQVEGILAYCLWDVVDIFEKKSRYCLAVDILLLITGLSLPGCFRNKKIFAITSSNDLDPSRQAFVQLLLSRRSRGKAVERLVIDLLHILRKEAKELQASSSGLQKMSRALRVREEHFCDQKSLFSHLLTSVGSTIPFSSFRTLAKRLQCPLKDIIQKNPNMEVAELKLRLENVEVPKINGENSNDVRIENINGWCPVTDISVANSIRSEPGTRCTFVGWEDDSELTSSKVHRSLNVEELALEEYSNGRLPNHHPELIEGPSGGWTGWHDEGGHIRALFRILCCHEILGSNSAPSKSELLYLTPYQTSPLDLHVAAQSLPEGHSVGGGCSVPCFYYHRKRCVDEFLDKIGQMTQDDLCDIVYETIKRNAAESKSANDTVLMRDVGELRKLSLIAAGIGGRLLSAIFRCLCYDYRHYCAGLPDLILSRALYKDSDTDLVNLVDWVGECVDAGLRPTADSGSILTDRDDDFLGCSMSDSLILSNQKSRKSKSLQIKNSDTQPTNSSPIVIPERLQLIHHDRKIKVQCMFVEVKSSNDRLDGRQQDWLNVIDKLGYARVCKFERSTKK